MDIGTRSPLSQLVVICQQSDAVACSELDTRGLCTSVQAQRLLTPTLATSQAGWRRYVAVQDMLARQQSRSFSRLLQQDTALRKAVILLKVS